MPCEDAPCCGCCDFNNDIASPELAEELDREALDSDEPWDAETDGDALASAGRGTDEDYRHAEDMLCEGYDEH